MARAALVLLLLVVPLQDAWSQLFSARKRARSSSPPTAPENSLIHEEREEMHSCKFTHDHFGSDCAAFSGVLYALFVFMA